MIYAKSMQENNSETSGTSGYKSFIFKFETAPPFLGKFLIQQNGQKLR